MKLSLGLKIRLFLFLTQMVEAGHAVSASNPINCSFAGEKASALIANHLRLQIRVENAGGIPFMGK